MEIILLEKYLHSDYALLERKGAIQPFVVAYKVEYNEDGSIKDWASGTYFTLLSDAGHYIYAKLHENDDEENVLYRNILSKYLEHIEDIYEFDNIDGIRIIADEAYSGNVIHKGYSWQDVFEKDFRKWIMADIKNKEAVYLTEEEKKFILDRYEGLI